nr:thymidine kinase [Propionibacterium sp.]
MAELTFFTGPMNCGKSTLALQIDYTEASAGRRGVRFTCQDRAGQSTISSRIGLAEAALEAHPHLDFWDFVTAGLTSGRRIDYLICDEAQFYEPAQIDQLARIVDDLGVDVYCFGILHDFRTEMFPGSARLVELSDRIEWLQARPRCWCGAPATHNARTVGGVMVTEGSQVVVGDTAPGAEVAYEVLCRKHHRRRETAWVGGMDLTPEPLPFDEGDV